jgi:hypothetical protein
MEANAMFAKIVASAVIGPQMEPLKLTLQLPVYPAFTELFCSIHRGAFCYLSGPREPVKLKSTMISPRDGNFGNPGIIFSIINGRPN